MGCQSHQEMPKHITNRKGTNMKYCLYLPIYALTIQIVARTASSASASNKPTKVAHTSENRQRRHFIGLLQVFTINFAPVALI